MEQKPYVSTVHFKTSETCGTDKLKVWRRYHLEDIVYRSLAGIVYLAAECMLVTDAGRHPQRSADNRTCLVKISHNQFGDRCFATAGPTLWNSLPEQLQQPDITFGQFE